MVINLFIFLFYSFIWQNFADDYNIYISNSVVCSTCNGSQNDPYNSVYAAFLQSVNLYPTVDSLIFKINATANPYYIFDSDITTQSPFQSFQGFFIFQVII